MKFSRKIVWVNLAICILLLLSACGPERLTTDVSHEFQERLLDSAALLIADAETDTPDIELDSIQYGCFSASSEEEICALFEYRSPKHIAGLDRTLAVIFSADDLQVVASREFAADHVQISFFPSNEDTDYIFYLGSTTYQGVPAYDYQLFKIGGAVWKPMPEAVPPFRDTGAYHLVDDSILCYREGDSHESYAWNSKTGCFESAFYQETRSAEGPIFEDPLDGKPLQWTALADFSPILEDGKPFLVGRAPSEGEKWVGQETTLDRFRKETESMAMYAEPPKISSFALCDMDQDGEQELVLAFDNAAGTFLILHRNGDGFQGAIQYAREFQALQTNGIYTSAGGAGINERQRMTFKDDAVQIEILAREDVVSGEEEYWIGEKEVTYPEYNDWVDDHSPGEVTWCR